VVTVEYSTLGGQEHAAISVIAKPTTQYLAALLYDIEEDIQHEVIITSWLNVLVYGFTVRRRWHPLLSLRDLVHPDWARGKSDGVIV
jgi:hypothetical protein